jgi:cytochrome c nitrite reductase small subunit
MQNASTPNGKWTVALLAFMGGMLAVVGIGLAVKGTDQASFCASCHAMDEAAWTHKQSLHAQFDCNECHTPASIPAKVSSKAKTGLHDVFVNVSGKVPDLLHARQDMKDVIQANCRRCHVSTTRSVAMDVKPYCTDCHRSVPHNRNLPIDRRKAADV